MHPEAAECCRTGVELIDKNFELLENGNLSHGSRYDC